MSTFINPFAPERRSLPCQATAIKAWTREVLECGGDVVVSVNQLACTERGSAPQETVVLLLLPDRRSLKFSIHKALYDVTEADVVAAAQSCEEAKAAG
ncbi:hypothetical protein CU102_23695 [Phyllobacterium brassicacearum]|uniref:Nitrate reductase n=1 Tax=Phyllobacterium brassicacearum TaxID=314235 RepID=A0A2P7BAC3_9HYPH|nr:hypothetical protein [Phyllobacterium brassicacearum]PSH63420.1 hypothetical protein CU102_23695 [Phyllobacterium brassicacearum]TDQ17996.1 hypothetical protein DEV91_1269 [Phyllobacterium brassicacearum]